MGWLWGDGIANSRRCGWRRRAGLVDGLSLRGTSRPAPSDDRFRFPGVCETTTPSGLARGRRSERYIRDSHVSFASTVTREEVGP